MSNSVVNVRVTAAIFGYDNPNQAELQRDLTLNLNQWDTMKEPHPKPELVGQ